MLKIADKDNLEVDLPDVLPNGRAGATASRPSVLSTEDKAAIDLINTKLDTLITGATATSSLNVAQDTAAIANGAAMLTPKFAKIDLAATGNILALVAGKKIRVLSLFLTVAGDTTVQFRSSTTSALTGAMTFKAGGGMAPPFSPVGLMETVAGEALNLLLGTAVQVSGGFTYVEV